MSISHIDTLTHSLDPRVKATIYRDSDLDEFRVRVRTEEGHAYVYFTDDKADAYGTAKAALLQAGPGEILTRNGKPV